MIYGGHMSIGGPRRPVGPPDFVVKLYQILEKEDPQLISWDDGRIVMLNPSQLSSEVLPKYFRHSRFSSFQRQLNNFGFRKVEGKGKLVPCTYLRDDLMGQPSSALLSIRRKGSQTSSKSRRENAPSSPCRYPTQMPLASVVSSSPITLLDAPNSSSQSGDMEASDVTHLSPATTSVALTAQTTLTSLPASQQQLERSPKRQRTQGNHLASTQPLTLQTTSAKSNYLTLDMGYSDVMVDNQHGHAGVGAPAVAAARISHNSGDGFLKEGRPMSLMPGRSYTPPSPPLHVSPVPSASAVSSASSLIIERRAPLPSPSTISQGPAHLVAAPPLATHFHTGVVGPNGITNGITNGMMPSTVLSSSTGPPLLEDAISTNDLIETLTLLDGGPLEFGAHPHITHILEGQSHLGDASPASTSQRSFPTQPVAHIKQTGAAQQALLDADNDPLSLVSRSRLFYIDTARQAHAQAIEVLASADKTMNKTMVPAWKHWSGTTKGAATIRTGKSSLPPIHRLPPNPNPSLLNPTTAALVMPKTTAALYQFDSSPARSQISSHHLASSTSQSSVADHQQQQQPQQHHLPQKPHESPVHHRYEPPLPSPPPSHPWADPQTHTLPPPHDQRGGGLVAAVVSCRCLPSPFPNILTRQHSSSSSSSSRG